MFADERQERILAIARRQGRVVVADLAAEFGVVTETIRRDLDVLETRHEVRRVHGGAVPAGETSAREVTVEVRTRQNSEQKHRIARAALSLVPTGSASIILDAGSTTGALAQVLPARSDLTVVTNAVPLAVLIGAGRGEVHMIGGRMRGVTEATVGEVAVNTLAQLRCDVAFLGSDGLTLRHGLSTPDSAEASVKRAMVRASQRAVALVDSSKVGRELLHRFADLEDIDVLVTDDGMDPELIRQIEAAGTTVVTA